MLLVRTGHHDLYYVQAATAATAHTGKANPQQYAESTHDAGDGLIATGRLHALIDECLLKSYHQAYHQTGRSCTQFPQSQANVQAEPS